MTPTAVGPARPAEFDAAEPTARPARAELVLALDTATPATVAALALGDRVLARFCHVDAMGHGEVLAPGIAGLFAQAGIDRTQVARVAVGVGPGPFTGLRVGLATATVLAATLGVPVVGVCSLDVISLGVAPTAFTAGDVVVASDARRKEVYWARYCAPGHRSSDPAVDKPASVATSGLVAGAGASQYPVAFPNAIRPSQPDAGLLARAVALNLVPLLPVRPLYLRRPDATVGGAVKPVLPVGSRP